MSLSCALRTSKFADTPLSAEEKNSRIGEGSEAVSVQQEPVNNIFSVRSICSGVKNQ